MYPWRFFKSAGLVQVKLENGEDVAHLEELDQKLWTVLSASNAGLRFDTRTLELLDTDGDGRVRAPEVLEAVRWLKLRLKSLDTLFDPAAATEIPYSALNESTQEGRELLETFRKIAAQTGHDDAKGVTPGEVAHIGDVFNATPFNGDGVITGQSASDAATADAVAAIAATEGTVPDRSGKDGIDQAKADAFFADAAAHVAWLEAGRADPAILFLGNDTAAAAGALQAVAEKIDDYFTRCHLAAFDGRATDAMNAAEGAFAEIAKNTLNDHADQLGAFPLATIAPDRPLPLSAVNPYWADAVAAFVERAAKPALGTQDLDKLSRAQWLEIKAKFAPYIAHAAAKAGTAVESLGEDKLRALLAGGKAQAAVNDLIARDLSFSGDYDRLVDAERLIRYVAHLGSYLRNYVNQADLYNPEQSAIYCTGTLYIDGRVCKLCFHVDNEGAHSGLAERSKCCIVYLALTRKSTGETRNACAVVTAGPVAPLYAGRNGIFYDRDGNDWDATITKVVESQVSLREAFWAPWRKLFTTISEQIKKFIGSREDAAVAGVSKAADGVGEAAAKPAAEAQAAGGGNAAALAGSVAALGVGIGMMGAAFAGLFGLVAGLPWWKTCLGAAAVVLAVSLPSVILTWFKLRQRDLGAILNAGGWAVNRPLRFPMRLARLFTRTADLPASARAARDPYASCTWCRVIVCALVAVAAAALVMWKLGICPFGGCSKNACANSCTEETCNAPAVDKQ